MVKNVEEIFFESFKKKYEKQDGKYSQNNIEKDPLAILDDSYMLQMFHALSTIFLNNSSGKLFQKPLSLENLSNSNDTIEERIIYFEDNSKFPYIENDLVQLIEKSNQPKPDKIPKLVVTGYLGSSLYGEWMNSWIVNKQFLKDHYPDYDEKKLSIQLELLTSILTTSFRIVPTELFTEFSKGLRLSINFEIIDDDVISLIIDSPKFEQSDDIANNVTITIKVSKNFQNNMLVNWELFSKQSSVSISKISQTIEHLMIKANNYFFNEITEKNRKQIEDLIKRLYKIDKNTDSKKHLELKSIQFLYALQFILIHMNESNSKSCSIFYPKLNLSNETPTVFFLFFDEFDTSLLNFLEEKCNLIIDGYSDFIKSKENKSFYDEDAYPPCKIYNVKNNILIRQSVNISGYFAQKLISETKMESTNIQYSFLVSSKKNLELTIRKFTENSKNIFDLKFKDAKKVTDYPIIDYKNFGDTSLKPIGVLKGHYTLLNKPQRIISIIPNDTSWNSVKIFKIIDLDLRQLQSNISENSNLNILQEITKQIPQTFGIEVSNNSISIIDDGVVKTTYNRFAEKYNRWQLKVGKEHHLKKYIEDFLTVTYKIRLHKEPDLSNSLDKILNVIERISSSGYHGAIFVLGKWANLESNVSSNLLVETLRERTLDEIDEELLFDLAVMDGATIINIDTKKENQYVYARRTLHPVRSDTPVTRPVDLLDIEEKFIDDNVKTIGSLYSLGTRHQSAIGLVCFTVCFVIIISSTGKISAYGNLKNKVEFYDQTKE